MRQNKKEAFLKTLAAGLAPFTLNKEIRFKQRK
jgi:hypothetical protein